MQQATPTLLKTEMSTLRRIRWQFKDGSLALESSLLKSHIGPLDLSARDVEIDTIKSQATGQDAEWEALSASEGPAGYLGQDAGGRRPLNGLQPRNNVQQPISDFLGKEVHRPKRSQHG